MLLDLVKNSWKPLILIALVSLTITWAFGISNQLITERTINGITIKTFNVYNYMQNISNAWNTYTNEFQNITPERTWDDTANFFNWNGLFNNLAYIFDWLYFPINLALWIIRWIAWLLIVLLSIIGWNTTQIEGVYQSQLVNLLAWLTEYFAIPYI